MSRLPPMGGRRRRRTESLESGEQADGVEPFAEIDNLPVAAAELRDIVLAIRFTGHGHFTHVYLDRDRRRKRLPHARTAACDARPARLNGDSPFPAGRTGDLPIFLPS